MSHKSISVIIIGVITLVASILMLLLPETMATKLPDTIEEVEDKSGTDSIREDEENEDLMVQKEEQL